MMRTVTLVILACAASLVGLTAGFTVPEKYAHIEACQQEELPRILDPTCHTGKRSGVPAPREMPENLEWMYTRCGRIKVEDYFVDDSFEGKGSNYAYTEKDIQDYEDRWHKLFFETPEMIHGLPHNARSIVEALQTMRDSAIKGKRVFVFGAGSPQWAVLIKFMGAKEVVTVDYSPLDYQHDDYPTITLDEMKEQVEGGTFEEFDTAVALSSFDHDGLGRYADPLCPDGDLMAMDMVKELISPEGHLFLSVPIGSDLVVWNMMRRYGIERLGLLIEGWAGVRKFGVSEEEAKKGENNFRKAHEPVIVLQPERVYVNDEL